MENPTLYQLALSRIKGIGTVYTKRLIERFGDAASIFRANRSDLERTGLLEKPIDAILNFSAWPDVRQELYRMQQDGIRPLFFTDPAYPRRLLSLPYVPALLFYQGTADLNATKIIAIVGTRQPTEYGKQTTANLIRELARPDLLILSGLAYGIDAVAHRTAMRCNLATIGVLGHGLDQIYPAEHFGLSLAMRRHGGLLTSFHHEVQPDLYTFPLRNRLLAGLCDALILIESGVEGGSLSAVESALKFKKKVFALPGRITDEKSQGCLQLIHEQKALPLLSADQLKAAIGWDWPASHHSHQPALPFFPTSHPIRNQPEPARSSSEPNRSQPDRAQPLFHPDNSHRTLEDQLVNLLAGEQPLSFEDLITLTRQPIPSISIALLNLELRDIIRSLPGRRYLLTG
jgi:DNA processing protein